MSPTKRLAIGLLGLAVLRAALAFAHTSALWAFDGSRFVPPALAFVLASAAFVLLVPAVGRRVEPALEAAGDALVRGDARAAAIAVAVVEVLVLLFPDRTLFVGDALLRNTVATMRLDLLVPGGPGQLLPIDRLLHVTIPRGLDAQKILSAANWSRALGAVEAAGLALLALAWVRVLGLRGAPAVVAWVAAAGGGYLLLFGGYGKASVEMTLLVLAVGVLAVRLARSGEGRGALGWALVLAVLTHRSALLLLPAGITALVVSRRRGEVRRGARWGMSWLMLAIVLVALATRLFATFTHYDVSEHLTPGDIGLAGGLFAASTAGVRALDLLNLFAWMAPLVLLVPLAMGRRAGDGGAAGDVGGAQDAGAVRDESLVLAALVLPQVATMVLLLPHQGLPRDWDVFAPSGCVLAAWTAAVIGRAVAREREAPRLAGALAAAVLGPLLAAFFTQASVDRGLARVRTFVEEPPVRSERANAMTWDFLGARYHQLAGPGLEADAFRRSASYAPNPRVLWAWGRAAERANHPKEALEAYRTLVGRDSTFADAWIAYGRVALDAGDAASAWDAAVRLRALKPDDPGVQSAYAVMDSIRKSAIANGTWSGR